jgi:hypothetical protein
MTERLGKRGISIENQQLGRLLEISENTSVGKLGINMLQNIDL